jgi:hypothetical protein
VNKAQKAQKNKLRIRFKVGQTVWIAYKDGCNVLMYDEWTVALVRKGNVWLDSGSENALVGPFKDETGKFKKKLGGGIIIRLRSIKPKCYRL